MNSQRASLTKENADLAQSMWPGRVGTNRPEGAEFFFREVRIVVALGDLLLLDSSGT